MKKLLSVLLSAVLIMTSLFALPVNAMAATSGSCGENAKYTYDLTKGTLVISGSGAMTDYSPTSKAPWNNADCIGNINSITISSGITAIGDYAFQQMTQVSEITIADTVKQIGDRAFDSCAVGAVPMTLTIPSSVEELGVKAFRGMSKLAAFSVSENNKYYKSVDGVLYDKSCSTLIQVPSRLDMTELTLPETVTVISADAFYKVYNVTDIYVPAGVNTVGDGISSVFTGSAITVHYPENSAFDWNIYLKNNDVSGVCYNQANCMHDVSGYIDELIEPSCTERGYTIHTCGECGYSYKDNYTDALGHSYETEKLAASSCTERGYTVHTCSECGYSYIDSYTAVLSHSYEKSVKTTKAKIGTNGKTVTTYKCSTCGYSYSTTQTISAPKTVTLSTTSYTYNGKTKTPSVTVKDSKGNKLVKGTDYTVTYASGRTKIGKYKVTVTFKGNYSGKKNLYFTISPKSVSLSTTTYTYNGNVRKPSVVIKDANGNKLSSSNYTVTYSSGRKNVGKYKVTIKLKNGHSGTYTKYFTIKPAKTSVTKLTAAKKAITVKWTKKTTQVTGYQIQYSTKSDFSSAKTVKVTKNSTTSKKLTGLSAKKKYYVRIRTYKTVNGTTYYSAWSAKKSIKTK